MDLKCPGNQKKKHFFLRDAKSRGNSNKTIGTPSSRWNRRKEQEQGFNNKQKIMTEHNA